MSPKNADPRRGAAAIALPANVDADTRAVMEADRAELADAHALDQHFLTGVSMLGRHANVSDLEAAAEERLGGWDSVDAVERAVDLVAWLTAEVVPLCTEVSAPTVASLSDAQHVAAELKHLEERTSSQWMRAGSSTPEGRGYWCAHRSVEAAAKAAKALRLAERRLSSVRLKPTRQFGDRPLDQCKRAAQRAGEAWAWACFISAEAPWAMRLLAADDLEREREFARAREALRAVGLADFGDDLVELVGRLVPLCDQVLADDRPVAEAAAAARAFVPDDAGEAVALAAQAPDLAGRAVSAGSDCTFGAAARRLLADALADVAEQLVTDGAGY